MGFHLFGEVSIIVRGAGLTGKAREMRRTRPAERNGKTLSPSKLSNDFMEKVLFTVTSWEFMRVFAYFVKSVTDRVLEVRAPYWRKMKAMVGRLPAVSIVSCQSGEAADKVGHWKLEVTRCCCQTRHRFRTKPRDGCPVTRGFGGNCDPWV